MIRTLATTAVPAVEPAAGDHLAAAGIARRFLAFLVDFLVLSIVLDIAYFSFELGRGFKPFATQQASIPWFLLLMWVYFTFQDGRGIQSWGKRLLGLKVVDREGNGITWTRSCCRTLVALVTCGAGFLWAVVNSDRRAFHDIVTGTRVVRIPAAQPDRS